MGLSQTLGTATAVQTQICASSSTSGAVMYTVPPGKIFRGYASNSRAYQQYRVEIVNESGGSVMHTGGFSTDGASQYEQGSTTVELTLLAGTSVKNQGGQDAYVFGVESDA